jgi:hypothetical protein
MVAVMPSMAVIIPGQHGPDVPVMQDDAAAAAVELEPHGAALVPLEGVRAGHGRAG